MQITLEQLKKFCTNSISKTLPSFVDPINKTLEKYNISNHKRVSLFITQTYFESDFYHTFKENLYYTNPDRLVHIFPSHISSKTAGDYIRDPEALANCVYANRMGNGDEDSGDGFRFCGRGAIQLTGKNNYESFAKDMSMSLDEIVKYTEAPEGAFMSAGWFWSTHHCNAVADTGDNTRLTEIINGGHNGLSVRNALASKALKIF